MIPGAPVRQWPGVALGLTAVALYLALALPGLGLPGLYYDEAADAVPAVQLLAGHPVETVRGHGLQILGGTFPLMAFDYVGAVHTYAALPFLAAFGTTPQALRLMTVAGGALTVLATFGWTKNISGSPWAGGAAALLLAVHPSFVYYTRQGIHVSSLLALWCVLALWCLAISRTSRNPVWPATAGLFLGIGITTKLLFLWVAVALAVLLTGAALRQWRTGAGAAAPWAGLGGQRVAATGAGLVVGTAPLLIYNLQTGGTLAALAAGARFSQHGVDNSRYLDNLLARLESFRLLLDGGHFWFLGATHGTAVNPLVGLAAAGGVVMMATRSKWRTQPVTAGTFLVALVVLVLLQSPVTLSDIYPTHLLLLLPVVAAVMGIAAAALAAGRRGPIVAVVAAVLVSVGFNVQVDLAYRQALRVSGGLAGHSDAVGKLAMYLDAQGAAQPVALDWGIRSSVQFLTGDRVRPLEIFGYTPQPDPGFETRARAALAVPETLFLARAPALAVYDRLAAFETVVRSTGHALQPVATFAQRDGTPVYLVYAAVPIR